MCLSSGIYSHHNVVNSRIVLEDGGDVRVNAEEHVERTLVNVISGIENVMLIFVGLVMLPKFLILLILARNGMGRFMRVVVLMFAFNVEKRRGLLWDVVPLPDGDYSLAKKSKRANFSGYRLQ